MSNYIGVRCPVCNKKYVQADDIVVCPVCGAPHHRECYAVNSACVFVSEHLGGKEWCPPASDAPPAAEDSQTASTDVSVCPNCRSNNPKDVVFCQICGRRMSEAPPPGNAGSPEPSVWGFPGIMQEINPASLMYGNLSPDEKIGGESVRDLAVYIGDNSAYYLTRFKVINEHPRSPSLNLSALIFGFLYFFHRKMYAIGTLLLLLFLAGSVPGFLQTRELIPNILYNFGIETDAVVNYALVAHYQPLVNITSMINFAVCLAMAFFANYFYFTKAIGDVRAIRKNRPEPHDEITYNESLFQKGGISRTAVIIVLSAVIAIHFIVAAVMLCQYVDIGGLYTR